MERTQVWITWKQYNFRIWSTYWTWYFKALYWCNSDLRWWSSFMTICDERQTTCPVHLLHIKFRTTWCTSKCLCAAGAIGKSYVRNFDLTIVGVLHVLHYNSSSLQSSPNYRLFASVKTVMGTVASTDKFSILQSHDFSLRRRDSLITILH